MKAETSFSLKDQLFNRDKVTYLASLFAGVDAQFAAHDFIEQVVSKFPELELKQRLEHIANTLVDYLPADYPSAVVVILKALPEELDPTKTDDDFGDFIIAPLSHYVATHGCSAEHLDRSLAALRELTKRFSAEDAIRAFINQFPEQTLAFLADCAQDDNYHVRRLASEGSRPKLPWSQKLVIDIEQPLPILDALFNDHTRYVTRSVANHLNDISKTHPELVVETLRGWRDTKQQAQKEMDFIVRHSLRTLVKKGDNSALKLLGFGDKPKLTIKAFKTSTPEVVVGEALVFDLVFVADKNQKLMIDYLITFPSANNKTSQKVFKLKQLTVSNDQEVMLKKKHPFRLMTTRRLYTGEHQVSLQINGQTMADLSFILIDSMTD